MLEDRLEAVGRRCALEELMSAIAHEINQPLGAIAAFARAAELMLGRNEPMVEDARQVLGSIVGAALSAGDDMRRIRSAIEGPPIVRARCDIAEVIDEILPTLHRVADRHHGIMSVNVAHEPLTVLADRLRVQLVVVALVENAFEAERNCARGAASVELNAGKRNEAVRVTVADRASGVPGGVRDRLFRPFVTTKGRAGLGLAACRSVVEAHDGRIGFEDVPDGGTRFWFELPAK